MNIEVEQLPDQINRLKKVLTSHARYDDFLEYGDGQEFHHKLEGFRMALAREEIDPAESMQSKP